MTQTSKTPRTDAVGRREYLDESMRYGDMVCLARELERENAELRAALAELVKTIESGNPRGYSFLTEQARAALGAQS